MLATFDAHATPPQFLKDIYKRYQKCNLKELDHDEAIIDPLNRPSDGGLHCIGNFASDDIKANVERFLGHKLENFQLKQAPVYGHALLPGLQIIPNIIPELVQFELLSRIFHRDLSNPNYKTNLHLHYDIPYERLSSSGDNVGSFFDLARSTEPFFHPKDPSLHKTLSISQVLDRKIRWITLGGQYDWTRKVYPDEQPPCFPTDIANYLEGFFPDMKAQAAIVNVYSPGDTLSLHRDVSEQCDRGLISLSMGCDAIFVIGQDTEGFEEGHGLAIHVRAGDLIYMDGPARFAWHGVPKILAETGPATIQSWPCSPPTAQANNFKSWRGWMAGKRINLNVRQMWES